jgi:hypothetical protein
MKFFRFKTTKFFIYNFSLITLSFINTTFFYSTLFSQTESLDSSGPPPPPTPTPSTIFPPGFSFPNFECSDLQNNLIPLKEKVFQHLKIFDEKLNLNYLKNVDISVVKNEKEFELIYHEMWRLIYTHMFSTFPPHLESVILYDAKSPNIKFVRHIDKKKSIQTWQNTLFKFLLKNSYQRNHFFSSFF